MIASLPRSTEHSKLMP